MPQAWLDVALFPHLDQLKHVLERPPSRAPSVDHIEHCEHGADLRCQNGYLLLPGKDWMPDSMALAARQEQALIASAETAHCFHTFRLHVLRSWKGCLLDCACSLCLEGDFC